MYSVFADLLREKGVKVADVSKGTGIKENTFSDWKAGRYTPKQDKLSLIADYFNVSLEYLTTGKDSRYSDEDAKLLALIKNNTSLCNAINQLIALPDDKQNHVYQLISYLEGI